MMKKQRYISSLLMAALLSGCSLVPNYERPATETPAGWSESSVSAPTSIAKDWWKNFQSEELNALMSEALSKNNDLGAAIQRVEQARATLRSTSSTLMPRIDASGNAGWESVDPPKVKRQSDTTYNAGLTVGYEFDLFGLNRANVESDEASLLSSEFSRDATALIVMSDVAKAYFNVLNLEERLIIADKNLESAQELLRIVQARFDAGATTALDVSQQKSDLASSEANRTAIELQLKIARSALAILVGKPPQNLVIAAKDLRTLPVPEIAPGQPSALLERRPDIRSTEADLIAANADIGAARAAFFPQLNIGLDAGIAATPIGDPATTTLSILSGLVAPIFSGGLLEGNLAFTKARKAELVENYRKTILVSFKDVEDALATVKASQQRETSLETAMNEARKAYDLSKQQYDVGSIDFQNLLDSRQTMLLAEDNYIQTKNDRLAAAVDLYKALGGGWAEDAPVATAPVAAPAATIPVQPALPAPAQVTPPAPATTAQ
jgi:NodT family efflux transporter outer membrane factor (OMF) lipoprotein